jgi:hypothetical protein
MKLNTTAGLHADRPSAPGSPQIRVAPVSGLPVILTIQALLFLLLLWKLPTFETYGNVLRNGLRIPFLGFLGVTLYLMVRSNAAGALKLFLAVCLFEPAIQVEYWLPTKFILAFVGGGVLILFSKARPLVISIEVVLCSIIGSLMIGNAVLSYGDNGQLVTWAFYSISGGVFCAFCRNLKVSLHDVVELAMVGGTSTVLMVGLSVASAYINNRLALSVNEFILTPFRLGQVNLESYNTFGLFCAIGFMNWLFYLLTGGTKWLGTTGAVICATGAAASKTVSVLVALSIVIPVFILHSTPKRRAWRVAGLFVWVSALATGIYIVQSDLDLLALRSRDTDTASGRIIVWERVMSLLASEPMGVGWSEYAAGAPIEQRYIDLRGEEYEPIISPHNIILTAFAFSGLLGGVSILCLMGLWAKRLTSRLVTTTIGSAAACIGLLTLLAHMTMDYWYFYFFFGVMWLYISPEGCSQQPKPRN